ncbi:hypothetical protein QBC42DRAFT_279092 [Cladorrhinum samala]|uniref:Uncharacterized protein n=1 Tax=Cladorrhinum samala TaxID=585594 RepID=A0AAV9HBK2_9PEZI|nr:hypothetical protein QBC42DRAFT_279092 [Cladorrhinum samala]
MGLSGMNAAAMTVLLSVGGKPPRTETGVTEGTMKVVVMFCLTIYFCGVCGMWNAPHFSRKPHIVMITAQHQKMEMKLSRHRKQALPLSAGQYLGKAKCMD